MLLTWTGYSNTFTNPKSSPVASIFLSLVKSTAFTSVMSEWGGQIPVHSSPRTPVHVNQSISLALFVAMACRVPRGASKNRRSFAPELVWRSFPVINVINGKKRFSPRYTIGLKKLAPNFYPIKSKTKTNRNSIAHVFPRFASAACIYRVLIGSLYSLCPLWLARVSTLALVSFGFSSLN